MARKKRKASNGAGSCYKRKDRVKEPWEVRITIGWKEVEKDGKIIKQQIRKVIGHYEKEAEGKKALALFEYKIGMDMTLEQLYNEWKTFHFQGLSESYRRDIESKWKTHISKLKYYKLEELKTKVLQEFCDSLPLSKHSTNTVKSTLGLMLHYAEKHEYITKNYINFVENRKEEKESIRKNFTETEINELWKHSGNSCIDSILIMIYSGLRIAELLNLKLEDINLDERFLIVRESKTKAGRNRIVPISKKILNIFSDPYGKEYFLEGRTGNKKQYTTFWREFNKFMEVLDMNHTIHDCRHTFASKMNAAKANTLSISRIIGHSDYNTTANIYTNIDTKELIAEIDRLQ